MADECTPTKMDPSPRRSRREPPPRKLFKEARGLGEPERDDDEPFNPQRSGYDPKLKKKGPVTDVGGDVKYLQNKPRDSFQPEAIPTGDLSRLPFRPDGRSSSMTRAEAASPTVPKTTSNASPTKRSRDAARSRSSRSKVDSRLADVTRGSGDTLRQRFSSARATTQRPREAGGDRVFNELLARMNSSDHKFTAHRSSDEMSWTEGLEPTTTSAAQRGSAQEQADEQATSTVGFAAEPETAAPPPLNTMSPPPASGQIQAPSQPEAAALSGDGASSSAIPPPTLHDRVTSVLSTLESLTTTMTLTIEAIKRELEDLRRSSPDRPEE